MEVGGQEPGQAGRAFADHPPPRLGRPGPNLQDARIEAQLPVDVAKTAAGERLDELGGDEFAVRDLIGPQMRDVARREGALDRIARDVEQLASVRPGVRVQRFRGPVLADHVVGQEVAVQEGVGMREQEPAQEGRRQRQVAQRLGREVDVRGRAPGPRGGGPEDEHRDGDDEVQAPRSGRETGASSAATFGHATRRLYTFTVTMVMVRWTPSADWILSTTMRPRVLWFAACT